MIPTPEVISSVFARIRSSVRIAGAFSTCSLALLATIPGRASDPPADPPPTRAVAPQFGAQFAAIRRFLEDPPRYQTLLVRRILFEPPVAFRDASEARAVARKLQAREVTLPAVTSIYHIRYQADPRAFFLRTLQDPGDVARFDTPRETPFAGRFESNWWAILDVTPGQIQLLRSPDGLDVSPDGITNTFHAGNQRWATEFLRLGMFDVLPESLSWGPDNNRFEAQTEEGTTCHGRLALLRPDSNVAIDLTYDAGLPSRRIRVTGEIHRDRWLPRRIDVDTLRVAQGLPVPTPYATLEALTTVISDAPLPRTDFSPEPYLHTNDLWVEIEKGEFYWLEASGTNVVRRHAARVQTGWSLRTLARTLFLAALVTAALWVVWKYILEWRGTRGSAALTSENRIQQTQTRRKS